MSVAALRALEAEDVSALAALLADPELAGRRGLEGDREGPRSEQAIRAAVEEDLDSEVGASWAVVVDGEVIGWATADWWWDALTPWMHVVIGGPHRRRGHGSTATRQVLDFLFTSTVAALAQWSVPDWDAAGIAFSDAMGGERAGARRRAVIHDGRFHDETRFFLTRRAWEEQHAARR